MPYQATSATHKLLALKKRIKVVAGGTSAGKTISTLQVLIDKAQSDARPTLTSVVSESFPHLRRGAMRDFLNIMQEHGYFKDAQWSKTDFTYTFETGSKLEFFSADQPSKVRGPRRDRLYINECNNVPYEAFDQLEVRTKDEIWLDFNPTSEFWYYTEVAPHRDHDFITLTYKDNEALDDNIVQSIEARKHNKAWWTVYGLGQLGEVEGKIYKDWQIVDQVPHEARLERRGLDFGFSADPAALIAVYYYNGGYILDQELYRTGMLNPALASFINNLHEPQTLVVADSSEPKSIAEIALAGVVIQGAKKVAGETETGSKMSYKRWGITHVQDLRISVTKRSVDLIREYRNYMWKFDRDGRQLPEPEDGNDHAMDALRYALESLTGKKSQVRIKRGAYGARPTKRGGMI
jgi:phage terminase large subunit